jgi:hypothetical protein
MLQPLDVSVFASVRVRRRLLDSTWVLDSFAKNDGINTMAAIDLVWQFLRDYTQQIEYPYALKEVIV